MIEGEKLSALMACEDLAARRQVRKLLAAHPEFVIHATCATAVEALRVLRSRPIDVLFSEPRLPDLGTAEMLEIAGAGARPGALVVVAADETDAFAAIEAGAADFLRLPVSVERFDKALQRVLLHLAVQNSHGREATESIRILGAQLLRRRRHGFPSRLVVRVGDRWRVVSTSTIEYVESDGNYSILHCGTSTLRVRETIGHLDGQLDPEVFFRVHRSAIVRLERVAELAHVNPGEYRIRLADGTELELARIRRDAFLAALEGVERAGEPVASV